MITAKPLEGLIAYLAKQNAFRKAKGIQEKNGFNF